MPPRLLAAAHGLHYGFVDTLAKYPTLWSFNSGAMKQDLEPVRGHAERALLLGAVVRVRARCRASSAPWAKLARRALPGAHRHRDRDHREPLLPRRGRRVRHLRHRLRGRPARHPSRARSGDRAPPARRPRRPDDRPRPRRARRRPTSTPRSRLLVGELGGTIFSGGDGVRLPPDAGARRRPGGGRHDGRAARDVGAEQNDFLARFVASTVPGQHHLTFKVPDLAATLERVRAAGFQPVSVDLRDPHWKEAFLQPREAHGTVVQLAEVAPRSPGHARARRGREAGRRASSPSGGRRRTAGRDARATPARRDVARRRCRPRSASSPGLLDGAIVGEDEAVGASSRGRAAAGSGSSSIPTRHRASCGSRSTTPVRRAGATVSGAPFVSSALTLQPGSLRRARALARRSAARSRARPDPRATAATPSAR